MLTTDMMIDLITSGIIGIGVVTGIIIFVCSCAIVFITIVRLTLAICDLIMNKIDNIEGKTKEDKYELWR